MKILIAYDGTVQSKTALKYGIARLREEGGRATVLHVFKSPIFVDYGAGPNAESLARAEAAGRVREAKRIIEEEGPGLWIRVVELDGDPVEQAVALAGEEKFDVILAPPRLKAIAKDAPCPAIIIPGNILVPVDSTELSPAALARIFREASATASKVVLLGLVPVHMYGHSEKDELKAVEKGTRASMKAIKRFLDEKGVESVETVRMGYPDEEILKALDEFSVSMVIIPMAEDAPSELGKAASIIQEDAALAKKPLMLVPSSR